MNELERLKKELADIKLGLVKLSLSQSNEWPDVLVEALRSYHADPEANPMKYKFTDDPNCTQIAEAFDRVANFAEELREPTAQATALQRVTSGEFSLKDVTVLSKFAATIHERTFERYGPLVQFRGTADYVRHHQVVGQACRLAAQNVVLVMKDFTEWLQAQVQNDLLT